MGEPTCIENKAGVWLKAFSMEVIQQDPFVIALYILKLNGRIRSLQRGKVFDKSHLPIQMWLP